ncbi:aspartate aminotransferase family protein [Acidobacteriota bacterium]
MIKLDKGKLYRDLTREYIKNHSRSDLHYKRASLSEIRGGSHNLRLFDPFPFYDVKAEGSSVSDIDGLTYVDFWQGHFANILGHNPPVVTEALKSCFQDGQGLLTGFPGEHQADLAELILNQLKLEKIRFTTSGTLASMYAIMLSKSFTKRDLVLKIGGGWHGAQPYALKGITAYSDGLSDIESAGLPSHLDSTIVTTRFNDIEDLRCKFDSYGDRLACFIIEPFLGAGGFIFAQKEYLREARDLTAKYGALLILDEVVSGFRFHAGGLHTLYTIVPDLTVLGKAIGGGMPVSALAGRGDVLNLTAPETPDRSRVKFEGGTFSAHPACMLAGKVFVTYLIEQEDLIYQKIGRLGALARTGIEKIFSRYDLDVKTTGFDEDVLDSSSCIGVQFLNQPIKRITSADQVWNSKVCDFDMRERIFKLAMLNEGFNTFHGYGCISLAHTEEEILSSLEAIERVARRFLKYKL